MVRKEKGKKDEKTVRDRQGRKRGKLREKEREREGERDRDRETKTETERDGKRAQVQHSQRILPFKLLHCL